MQEQEFPALFRETDLGIPGMTAHFERRVAPPPLELISNINCVAFVSDHCVILTLADGAVEIPGGTVEPDESYEATLRRELMEETGARLLKYAPLGAWRMVSSLAKPFRPHLPHPTAYRYVVHAEVEIVGSPGNEGEQVAAVELVPVDEAAARFRAAGRSELAELYQLAGVLHSDEKE